MTQNVSVAKVKNNLSEYLAKVAYADENFIITKRNKPIAALVNLEDFKTIQSNKDQEGLATVIGKWENFDEIYDDIMRIYKSRQTVEGRDVSF